MPMPGSRLPIEQKAMNTYNGTRRVEKREAGFQGEEIINECRILNTAFIISLKNPNCFPMAFPFGELTKKCSSRRISTECGDDSKQKSSIWRISMSAEGIE
jgi:hypothetical protein